MVLVYWFVSNMVYFLSLAWKHLGITSKLSLTVSTYIMGTVRFKQLFLIIWPLSSSTVPLVPCQSWQLENHVWFGKTPRKFIFSSLIWMRFRLVWMRFRIAWMRFRLLWMRFRLLWMRFRLVVRASDCQCRRRNSHGFDPSIPAPGIWGAADEAVLNTVHRENFLSVRCHPPVF
jgi:hypothetical protein